MTDYRDLPHTVYLHRDSAGNILYVGCTVDLGRRNDNHRSGSGWWGDVATVEIDSVQPDYLAGYYREYALIRQHEPPYNIHGNPAVWRERAAWQELATRYGIDEALRLTAGCTAADALTVALAAA